MMRRRGTQNRKKPTLARKAHLLIKATGYPVPRVFLRGPKPPKENELGCFYEDKRRFRLRIDVNFRKWSVHAIQVLAHELAHYKLHQGGKSTPEYIIEFEAELQSLFALRWVNLYHPKFVYHARGYIRQSCLSRFFVMGATPTKGWDRPVMDWCGFKFPKPPVERAVVRYRSYSDHVLCDKTLSTQEMVDIITTLPKHFWVVPREDLHAASYWEVPK